MRDQDLFFVPDLVPSLLGPGSEDVTRAARRFVSPRVLKHAQTIQQSFLASGPVKHVALEQVLTPRVAADIGRALKAARFRRHHHAPYRIEVSPLDGLGASALQRFCAWLGTDEAARFHGWLTGWPEGEWDALHARQVQVARARRGDEFPVHVDMEEEGLAAVYNFSDGFGPDDGGELSFPDAGGGELLRLPPLFNTLMLFRPADAPHGVRKVEGRKTRFSVTAFFAK